MTSTCVVIDYGSGNLRSAAKALERVSDGVRILVSSKPQDVLTADRIVLPGVGAFGDCKAGLAAIPGMMDALTQAVVHDTKPFLGICVGMQLMAEWGLEHGKHQGFGWVKGDIAPLHPRDPALKIPHMGWNSLNLTPSGKAHPLLKDVDDGAHVYFVHSYALNGNETDVLAYCDYGGAFPAMIARDNRAGVQFHPEKSQRLGLTILKNFLKWQP